VKSLEQFRDIYDRANVKGRLGLVLVGMSGLEKKLARYAQLYSRRWLCSYDDNDKPKRNFPILEYKWQQLNIPYIADDPATQETIAAIINATNCNLRLIKHLFDQIARGFGERFWITSIKMLFMLHAEMLVIGSD